MTDTVTVPQVLVFGAVGGAETGSAVEEQSIHAQDNEKLRRPSAAASGGRKQTSDQKARGVLQKLRTAGGHSSKIPKRSAPDGDHHEGVGVRQTEPMQQVVAKRLRKFEKKLRQIESIESKLRGGDRLDLEQLAVLRNKPDVLGEIAILRSICEAACTLEEEWQHFASKAAKRVVSLVLSAALPDEASWTDCLAGLRAYGVAGGPHEMALQEQSAEAEPGIAGVANPETLTKSLAKDAIQWLTDDLVASFGQGPFCKEANGDQPTSLQMKPSAFADLLRWKLNTTVRKERPTHMLGMTRGQCPHAPAIRVDSVQAGKSLCPSVSPSPSTGGEKMQASEQDSLLAHPMSTQADEPSPPVGAPSASENITIDSAESQEKESRAGVDCLGKSIPREASASTAHIACPDPRFDLEGHVPLVRENESGAATSDGSRQDSHLASPQTAQGIEAAAGADTRARGRRTEESRGLFKKRSNPKGRRTEWKPANRPLEMNAKDSPGKGDDGAGCAPADAIKHSLGRHGNNSDDSVLRKTLHGEVENGADGKNAQTVPQDYVKREFPDDGASARDECQQRTTYPSAPPGLRPVEGEAPVLRKEDRAFSSGDSQAAATTVSSEAHNTVARSDPKLVLECSEMDLQGDWGAAGSLESFSADTRGGSGDSYETDLNGAVEGFQSISRGYEQAHTAAAQAAALASAPYDHRYAALFNLCLQQGLKYIHPQANWQQAEERLLALATSRAQAIASGPYQERYAVLYNAYLTPGDYPFLPWTEPPSGTLSAYEGKSPSPSEQAKQRQSLLGAPVHEPSPYRRLEGALTAPSVCPSGSPVYSAPTNELLEAVYRPVAAGSTHKAMPECAGAGPGYGVPSHPVWDSSFSMVVPYPSQPYGSHSHSSAHRFV